MSGADDQRADERLRDAVVCHCYEIAGPVGGGHWASCLAEEIGDEVTAVLVDRDRLRAELAETRAKRGQHLNALRTGTAMYEAAMRRLAEQRESRDIVWWMGANLGRAYTAGDALAAAGRDLYDVRRWSSEDETEVQQRFLDAHGAWRSVRGDARTTPAADVRDPASETHRTSAAPAEHHVEAFVHDGGCQDWGWQCFTCGEEDCGYDSLAKAERGGDQHRVVALVESAAPADDTAAPGEPIEELREELALRRSGIAAAPPCTDGYWRNERHPPPPSATSGENADPREDT